MNVVAGQVLDPHSVAAVASFAWPVASGSVAVGYVLAGRAVAAQTVLGGVAARPSAEPAAVVFAAQPSAEPVARALLLSLLLGLLLLSLLLSLLLCLLLLCLLLLSLLLQLLLCPLLLGLLLTLLLSPLLLGLLCPLLLGLLFPLLLGLLLTLLLSPLLLGLLFPLLLSPLLLGLLFPLLPAALCPVPAASSAAGPVADVAAQPSAAGPVVPSALHVHVGKEFEKRRPQSAELPQPRFSLKNFHPSKRLNLSNALKLVMDPHTRLYLILAAGCLAGERTMLSVRDPQAFRRTLADVLVFFRFKQSYKEGGRMSRKNMRDYSLHAGRRRFLPQSKRTEPHE